MLHGVSDDKSLDDLKPWVVTHECYLRLLNYLDDNGYNTITFEDLDKGIGDKNVIITFDDCPKHLHDFAVSELTKRNMKAVFYMPTAHIDGYNEWNVKDGHSRMDLMNKQDLKKLVELGMEVGSHAHKHVMLEELSQDEVISAFQLSNKSLEDITDKKVITAAYPYGSIPDNFYSIMEGIGYKYAVSVYSLRETKYNLRRWTLYDADTIEDIKNKMSVKYAYYRSVADNYSHYSKSVLRALYNKYAGVKKMVVK